MTMADRNWKHKDSDTSPTLDPQYTRIMCVSPSQPFQQPDNDISSSTHHSPPPETTDLVSGIYSSDIAPARTASPTTSKLSQEHSIIENTNPDLVTEPYDQTSPILTRKINTICPETNDRNKFGHFPRSTIYRAPNQRSAEAINRRRHKSSRSVSESSDNNLTQFDLESDDEGGGSKVHNTKAPISPTLSSLSENLQAMCSQDISLEDEDDENVFTNSGDVLENWVIGLEPQTSRRRRNSLSLRERRFCSFEDDSDESLLGACGGLELSRENKYLDTSLIREQRSRSFIESSHGCITDLFTDAKKDVGNVIEERCHHSFESIRFHGLLSESQDFRADYFESGSKYTDSCPVLTTDTASGDSDGVSAASLATPGPNSSSAVAIVQSRPRVGVVSSSRQRRVSVTTNIRLSGGFVLPWSSLPNEGVSVSTQTPHVTSMMIQQILDTPIALPNEARGTAASRLHHRSESGVPLPPLPTPLPDIITSVRRDRSQSVPNLQSLAMRERARIVGQELRMISDEFNCRRSLTPVHEEFDGHPASFPRMHQSHVRNTITQFGALLRDTIRGRQNI